MATSTLDNNPYSGIAASDDYSGIGTAEHDYSDLIVPMQEPDMPISDAGPAEPPVNAEAMQAFDVGQAAKEVALLPVEANFRARNDRERVFGMLRDQRDKLAALDTEAQQAKAQGDESALGAIELRKMGGEEELAKMEAEATQRFGLLRTGPEEGEAAVRRSITAAGETPPAFQSGALSLFGGLEAQGAAAMRHLGIPGAEALAEDAARASTVANVAQGTSSDIARGVGDVAAMAIGNPKGKLGIITAALRGAGQAETDALNNGATQEQAHQVALSTFPQLFAMLAAGGAAARGVEALIPKTASAATKALAEFGGAAGANVAVSAATHALNDQPYGTRALTADVLFAALPGLHGYERAQAEELLRQVKPTGEPNALENTSTSTADGSLRPRSEIQELPPSQGGEGVQSSGQGVGDTQQRVARSTPGEAQQVVPAIRVNGETLKGNVGDTHLDIINRLKEEDPVKYAEAIGDFDSKSNPNFFVDAQGNELSREELKQKFGVSDSQGLAKLQSEPANLGPGAANVEEFTSRPVREIGAYNADVDARRAARGAEPLFSVAREEAPATWDKAVASIEQDPTLPDRIISEINAGTRKSVTREDQTAILWKVIDLENRRLDAEEKAANPEMDPVDREIYREDFQRLDKELNAAEEANRKAGTFSATALNIRRLIANENFTYSRMLRRAEISKGEPLTEPEKAEIKKQSEGILRTENELAAKDPNSPESQVDESIRAIEEEAKKNPEFTPEVLSLADRIVARLDKAAEAALARFRSKLSRASTGVDPTLLLDVVTYGASKIAKGLVKFSQWSAAMVRDMGEEVKPYLEEAWNGANKHLDDRVNASTSPKQRVKVKEAITKENVGKIADALGENLKAEVTGGKKLSDLRSQVRKLTETLVRGGIKGRDAVVDAVHERLKTIDPKITRRQTMDLMSGYGDFKKLNPEAVKAEVRDINQQLQLVAKIEDVQAKVPLKKSGVERQALSDESRRLTAELNENIKKLGVVVSDPATQLKTILAAQETRLTNRIKDLKAEIAAGERRVKTKTSPPTNEKIEALKKTLGEVEAEHEKILGKRQSTEAQKVNAIKAALQRRNSDLQERIAKGEFEPRKKKPSVDLSKDSQAVAAKAENERLKKQFALKQHQFQQAQRSRVQKSWDFIKDVAGASRSLITSADVSAPFRQGGFLLIGDLVTNPTRAAKQIGSMFHQLVSEGAFERAQAELALRPNADLYQKSGLYFSDLDSKLSAREESMRSNLAEKIPVLGRIVRASNRAYTGFLNRQRADAFDALVEALGGKAVLSDADTKLLANAVNIFTGRGTAAGFERSANTLAKYFFSPRFLASRIQTLIGHPIAGALGKGASPATRRIIAQQYAKFGLGLAAIYGLALLAGAKVDKDPRSSDFGKLRFGKTRIDPLTGLQQVFVLMTRTATGKQTVQGQVKPVTGDTYYRFVRSKLAPVPGTLLDLRLGKNVVGEKVTPASAAENLTVPMSYQDVAKVYKEHGAVKGTVLEMLNLMGMGLQNYGK